MTVQEAAELVLSIIESQIERWNYASYSSVRNELQREAGDEWFAVSAKGRLNFSRELLDECHKLPGWGNLQWNAPRQRWTRKESS